jgi:hypothetical protein
MPERFPILLLVPALLAACVNTDPGRAATHRDVSIQTNFHTGWRSVDHDLYDDHPVFGMELQVEPHDQPFGYEIGATLATDDEGLGGGFEEDADFYEGYVGVRKTWGDEYAYVRPYASLGGSYVKVDREITGPGFARDASDWSGGGYARVGAYGLLGTADIDGGTRFVLGADVRVVDRHQVLGVGDRVEAEGAVELVRIVGREHPAAQALQLGVSKRGGDQALPQPVSAVLRHDEDVAQVGEGGAVRHDAGEADLLVPPVGAEVDRVGQGARDDVARDTTCPVAAGQEVLHEVEVEPRGVAVELVVVRFGRHGVDRNR